MHTKAYYTARHLLEVLDRPAEDHLQRLGLALGLRAPQQRRDLVKV